VNKEYYEPIKCNNKSAPTRLYAHSDKQPLQSGNCISASTIQIAKELIVSDDLPDL
jgi:hypothetical protein